MKTPDKWWYSADGKRGFCWSEVVGFVMKTAPTGGAFPTTLYLYLRGAMMQLMGVEAEAVYKLLPKKETSLRE